MPCTDLVIRVLFKGVVAAGLFRASVFDEVALYQHLDMALDRLRGDTRLGLDSRDEAIQCFVDLLSLFNAFLPQPELKHIRGHPEHAQGGVLTFVLAIYRPYRIIRLLYLALLPQSKYILDIHTCKGY